MSCKTKQDGSKKTDRNEPRKRYAARLFLRRECMRRLGKDPMDNHTDYRVCSDQTTIPITRQVTWVGKDNKTRKETVRFYVPEAVGIHSNLNNSTTSTTRDNGGVGNTRKRKLTLETVQQRL